MKQKKSSELIAYGFAASYCAAQLAWLLIAGIMGTIIMDGEHLFEICIGAFMISILPTAACSLILAAFYQIIWIKLHIRWPAYLFAIFLTAAVFSLPSFNKSIESFSVLLFMSIPGLSGAIAVDFIHRSNTDKEKTNGYVDTIT